PGMKTKQPGAPTSIFAVSIASGKTKFPANPTSVDEYLTATPEPARTMLLNMRAAIRSVLPAEATEVISYKIPAFKLKKIVVWFAAFQDHCSLFPTAAIIDQFKP